MLSARVAFAADAARSAAFVFVAPGGESAGGYTSPTLHVGFGGEFVFAKTLGVGGDVGGFGLTRDYISTALFTVSPSGFYHFPVRSTRLDPYVVAGYSAFTRFTDGNLNLFHYGAGVNYWFRPRLGVKIEFRDHIEQFDNPVHFWGFRFALNFR